RPYTCGECGRGFSYSSAFLKHRRAHLAEGAEQGAGPKRRRKRKGAGFEEGHAPRACGAGLGEGPALPAHLRGHAQPYTCGECGQRFGGSAALVRHQR
ncbi:ZN345 protein, partial [Oxylabes madagascariensis]|nr:ZN345 protein [Oxylabes madagascariensis]